MVLGENKAGRWTLVVLWDLTVFCLLDELFISKLRESEERCYWIRIFSGFSASPFCQKMHFAQIPAYPAIW